MGYWQGSFEHRGQFGPDSHDDFPEGTAYFTPPKITLKQIFGDPTNMNKDLVYEYDYGAS